MIYIDKGFIIYCNVNTVHEDHHTRILASEVLYYIMIDSETNIKCIGDDDSDV